MSTYVLLHGAGGTAWYWHLVAAEMRGRGREVVAVDLPCDDDSASLEQYTDAVVEAIGDRSEVILVAQSLAGFTAPLVCARRSIGLLVLVAAMVPRPNETGLEWWTSTGWEELDLPHTLEADGPQDVFLHDVPAGIAAEAMSRARDQSRTPMQEPWPLSGWPDVPTRFVLCRDDRFFPAEWLRGVVQERLGITPDEIDGGHTPALSRPKELAERLEAYRQELAMPPPYTVRRLSDVEDSAPQFGLGDVQQTRFAGEALDAEHTGLTLQRLEPGARPGFAHRHEAAEEVYVVLSGSGRMKLDDDVVKLERLDAVRVAPEVTRAFEAGPDGLELLAFGARHPGDGEVFAEWWS